MLLTEPAPSIKIYDKKLKSTSVFHAEIYKIYDELFHLHQDSVFSVDEILNIKLNEDYIPTPQYSYHFPNQRNSWKSWTINTKKNCQYVDKKTFELISYEIPFPQSEIIKSIKKNICKPSTVLSVGHSEFNKMDLIMFEADISGKRLERDNGIVSEHNFHDYLDWDVFTLLSEHGLEPHIMLSGGRSIYLQWFFTDFITKTKLERFKKMAEGLFKVSPCIKIDGCNLQMPVRLPGYHYYENCRYYSNKKGHLSSYINVENRTKSKCKKEVWEYLENIKRISFPKISLIKILNENIKDIQSIAKFYDNVDPLPESIHEEEQVMNMDIVNAIESIVGVDKEQGSRKELKNNSEEEFFSTMRDGQNSEYAMHNDVSGRQNIVDYDYEKYLQNGIPKGLSYELLVKDFNFPLYAVNKYKSIETAHSRLNGILLIGISDGDRETVKDRSQKLTSCFKKINEMGYCVVGHKYTLTAKDRRILNKIMDKARKYIKYRKDVKKVKRVLIYMYKKIKQYGEADLERDVIAKECKLRNMTTSKYIRMFTDIECYSGKDVTNCNSKADIPVFRAVKCHFWNKNGNNKGLVRRYAFIST